MKIAIGSDHGGWKLKEALTAFLKKKGYELRDYGTYSQDSCDYPVFAYKAAAAVSRKECRRGILICKSGIGNSIVANKLPGIRAALVHSILAAKLSRLHNDANVLVLGSRFLSAALAKRIAAAWLKTGFEGGRHSRRVRQIAAIERRTFLRR